LEKKKFVQNFYSMGANEQNIPKISKFVFGDGPTKMAYCPKRNRF
jgi:hypothetical protein